MMKRFGYLVLGIAAAAVLSQGAVFAETGDNPGESKKCKVTIDRSQDAGVFDVTRQTYDDGDCICYAYTGPASQPPGVEQKVADLVADKTCPGAKVMAVTGPGPGAAAGGSGFFAGPLAPLLGLGALGGGTAALAAGGNATPVSP